MNAAFAHIIRVVDGKIAELRQITDTNEWAAGLRDSAPDQ
jgi:ketosteroid isomerase-like protein